MQKAEDATVFDEFYSMRNPAVVLLTKEERDTLNRMKAEGSSLRSYFLSLVLSYCQLDFHHLCTSPSMFAAAHRMEEYFKGQIPSTLAQTLSKEEQQQFRDMMDCCLRESLKLVEAYHHKRSKKRSSIDQQEAEEAYPCPVDLEHLVASTETYVRDIEQQVSALKVIFPS
ncbi:hypothetical protein V5O48_013362 [Marasmius crinis-equi]|uniref:Uncharacterized protein n=1 Tax=Marasmius crinis-equi TaxID=585013 RepID=A0ABR3F0Q1_9AGAR